MNWKTRRKTNTNQWEKAPSGFHYCGPHTPPLHTITPFPTRLWFRAGLELVPAQGCAGLIFHQNKSYRVYVAAHSRITMTAEKADLFISWSSLLS